jgi:K+-sensing histidine kinase KdpD
MLIRRAKRVSDFLDAEYFAISVQASGDLSTLPESDRDAVSRHLNFARNLHLETQVLEGEDIAATLVDFARRNQITEIFLARPADRQWLRHIDAMRHNDLRPVFRPSLARQALPKFLYFLYTRPVNFDTSLIAPRIR